MGVSVWYFGPDGTARSFGIYSKRVEALVGEAASPCSPTMGESPDSSVM